MTKPKFAKIENESGYIKDMSNRAILSTDIEILLVMMF